MRAMARFEILKPESNEAPGALESLNGSMIRTDQRAIEDLTGLATITSTLAGSSCTSDAALADVDLVDVLSGCMENKADADQLAAGLLEMENELKALTDDETSFLQFPSILQDLFSPESPNGKDASTTAAIPPSVSDEYLYPNTQPLSQSIVDHQAIAQHPLLPLISSILWKHTCQTDEPLSASENALLDSFQSRSELDTFMRDTVSRAIQLSKDGNDTDSLMQSIDNEGSYFTSEMSTFCQNLLQPDPVPSSNSESPGQIQHEPSQQLPDENPSLAKKNKQKIRPGGGKKCARLSQRNTQILREWLLDHADNPFPTDSEKDMLCLRTGLTLSKLTTWFVNSRRRILAPLGLKNYHKK